jgi:hypothetical protein
MGLWDYISSPPIRQQCTKIFFAKNTQKKIFAGYRPLLTDCVSQNVFLVRPKKEKNIWEQNIFKD